MTEIGKRLESLRGEMTQRQFAANLGIPLTSYTNWLIGPSSPKMEYLIQICTKLGVSSDWLLGLSGKAPEGESRQASPPDCETCRFKRFAEAFAEAFKAIQNPL